MIVRTLGKKILLDSKLYVLLYKLTPLLIILAPILLLYLTRFQERNEFQQPTLKNKIYDYKLSKVTHDIQFASDFGVHVQQVQGLIGGECLLISFVNNHYQRRLISLLHDALINQKVLTKSVVFVGYSRTQDLQTWVNKYQDGWTKYNYGVIRAAVNLNLTQTSSGIIYDIFGVNGRHCDSDYYFTFAELMNKVRIKYRSCEYKFPSLKPLLARLPDLNAGDTYNFLVNLACSLNIQKQGHSVLLPRGIQSSTLRSGYLGESPLKQSQILSVVFSWVKQFSLQEGNLHSSYTLWYPTQKNNLLGVKLYIAPYLLFLIGSVIRLLYFHLQSPIYWDDCKFRPLDLLFICLLSLGVCVRPGMYLLGLYLLLGASKYTHGPRSREEMQYWQHLILAVMISSGVHSCIYFMPVSLFHYIGYLLILLPRPLSRVIVVGVFLFLVYTFSFALVVSTLEALIGLRHLSLVPLTILMIWVVM